MLHSWGACTLAEGHDFFFCWCFDLSAPMYLRLGHRGPTGQVEEAGCARGSKDDEDYGRIVAVVQFSSPAPGGKRQRVSKERKNGMTSERAEAREG